MRRIALTADGMVIGRTLRNHFPAVRFVRITHPHCGQHFVFAILTRRCISSFHRGCGRRDRARWGDETMSTRYHATAYWSASRALQARNYSKRRHDAFDTMSWLMRCGPGRIRPLARVALLRFNSRWTPGTTISDMTGTYRLSADGRCAERIGAPHPWVAEYGLVVM